MFQKKYVGWCLIAMVGMLFFLSGTSAKAVEDENENNKNKTDIKTNMTTQLEAFAGRGGANIAAPDDPRELVAKSLKIVLSVIGTLAMVYTVYGGFLVMTSSGEEDKISKGKKIIFYGVFGIFIMLTSYSIAGLVWQLYRRAEGNPFGTFFEYNVVSTQEKFYNADQHGGSTLPKENFYFFED